MTSDKVAPLVFVDVETTGLGDDDEIWEFAAIRRTTGLPDREHRVFVEHDVDKAARLPESFRKDHEARYDPNAALSRHDAADFVRMVTRSTTAGGRAHLVGCNPSFDAGMLARLLATVHVEPAWSYHLIDIEAMAIGYLHAKADQLAKTARVSFHDPVSQDLRKLARPPFKSDVLFRAVGVDPDQYDRHQALGDAKLVRDVFDRIIGA